MFRFGLYVSRRIFQFYTVATFFNYCVKYMLSCLISTPYTHIKVTSNILLLQKSTSRRACARPIFLTGLSISKSIILISQSKISYQSSWLVLVLCPHTRCIQFNLPAICLVWTPPWHNPKQFTFQWLNRMHYKAFHQ